MRTNHHPFNPSLKPVFSKQSCNAASGYPQDSRHLFYYLIRISEHYEILPAAFHFIEQCLDEVAAQYQVRFIETYRPDEIRLQLNNPDSTLPTERQNRESLNKCLVQSAPIILTSPAWLQNISQAATSQTKEAVMLLSVYRDLTPTEQGESSLGDAYRGLLLESGIELPALHTRAFTQQKQISGCMFDFAALQLSLARFPRTFFPEILGFTLAYCQSRSPVEPFFSFDNLRTLNCSTHFFSARYQLLDSQISSIVKTIRSYVRQFLSQEDSLWLRIQKGFWLFQHHTECCNKELQLQLLKSLSPQQAFVNLLKQKAAFAYGHHKNIRLGGKTLDEWFAQSPFDSESFLVALKQSSYVNNENPADSRLLKLFEFHGPMFGVFSPSEKKILETWLMSDDKEIQKPENFTVVSPKPSTTSQILHPPNHSVSQEIDYPSLNNRELYYYLLNVELFPDVLDAARRKAQKTLRTAGLFSRLPFRQYSHQAFDDYIHRLYQKEIESYQPLKEKPDLSKEAYLFGIEQLAPAILIDGCWLQDIGQLRFLSNHAIGNILLRIYIDEIGNGVLQQNHPYIYRELLESLNIPLPSVHTREFTAHTGFIDSAFDLPVYLLSISHFPALFLPEILGLNMAIELSGLGKVYLRLSDELKFWGIDPTIVNLHISIDNFASGHSAMARDSIQLYLDEISACYGENEMHRHWHRIYSGYCSLDSASRNFKLSLVSRYLIRKTGQFFKRDRNDANHLLKKIPVEK